MQKHRTTNAWHIALKLCLQHIAHYVCMHRWMYVYIYIHMYSMHPYTHTHGHICVYAYVSVIYIYIYLFIFLFICLRLYHCDHVVPRSRGMPAHCPKIMKGTPCWGTIPQVLRARRPQPQTTCRPRVNPKSHHKKSQAHNFKTY